MKPRHGLTAEQVREHLHYDPETGVFTRKIALSPAVKVGDVAGGVRPDGYIQVGIKGVNYLAHRLAWLYMTGEWPDDLIDHSNGIKDDNRWENLRAAKRHENMHNRKGFGATSHHKGVCWHKRAKRWYASITINKKRIPLGSFKNEEDAARAYNEAAKKYQGEYAYQISTTEGKSA